MIEEVYLWDIRLIGNQNPVGWSKLTKQYGSRRSKTAYVSAKNQDEAQHVAEELFTRNGYEVPDLYVERSYHVKSMLRAIY